MNVAELKITLDKEGVNPIYYDLTGSTKRAWTGAFILENIQDGWLVYYSERGMKHELIKFSSEDEACKHILNRLLHDPAYKVFLPKKRGFSGWFEKYWPY
jgi:hypothetical protein